MNLIIGIIIAILILLFISSVVVMLIITIPIAKKQFENTFVRTSKEKWGRANSCPENAEHSVMFDLGIAWAEKYKEYIKEVSIKSDGLTLYGEYFDFGFDKTAIIIPGRAESLLYEYYFGEPYRKAGYNVFVPDVRAHGLSEGIYSGLGIKDKTDIKNWIDFLHNEYNCSNFVIHGICIGSSTAIFLLAENQKYLNSIVIEGPYASFYNVLKQRIRTAGHISFPVAEEMALLVLSKIKVNIFTQLPIKYIKKIKKPILFLCGKEDVSSLPKLADKMYKVCGSKDKERVWFEHGAHSHLRIADTEKYDNSIIEFLNKYN